MHLLIIIYAASLSHAKTFEQTKITIMCCVSALHFCTNVIFFILFFLPCELPIFDIQTCEGESISNQPIPFLMHRDGHDFHALFQYMFYTWVQNCKFIESFFNKILNVKHG